ncbi:hypothetical protein FSP39_009787 [Pinctada imbricata]|uniref:Carboxylesterase type B domain-containing protein n=1 Tax=Pinctada imbricata TaxID=66713 RepID=A0AA88Y8S4_PINIB|nr:hypothetical protein FSP39_009787 [Pinctada imbricata]
MGFVDIFMSVIYLMIEFNLINSEVFLRELGSLTPRIKQGMIRGQVVEFPNTNLLPVETFIGLRYASLRSGFLRFMPPATVTERWQDLRNKVRYSGVCSQVMLKKNSTPDGLNRQLKRRLQKTKLQTAECLSLNLFVPRKYSK